VAENRERQSGREVKCGDPIPGSVYYRDFCRICGEPIRVKKEDLNNKEGNFCGCSKKPRASGVGLVSRQKQKQGEIAVESYTES
jgi:hypothetical protein